MVLKVLIILIGLFVIAIIFVVIKMGLVKGKFFKTTLECSISPTEEIVDGEVKGFFRRLCKCFKQKKQVIPAGAIKVTKENVFDKIEA